MLDDYTELPASQARPDTPTVRAGGDTDCPDAMPCADPTPDPRPGSDRPASHPDADTQERCAGGDTNHPDAEVLTSPSSFSRPGADSLVDHSSSDDQTWTPDEGTNIRSDQMTADARPAAVAAEQTHPDEASDLAMSTAFAPRPGVSLADPTLALLADAVDDLERTRIANENRLRALLRPVDVLDEDGLARGLGLSETDPSVATLARIVDALKAQEHQAVLGLRRAVRKHPLGQWAKKRSGLGEKQVGRLLASLGDPAWNYLHDRPRTVSELWAFCGYHVIDGAAPRRERGQRSNWSNTAKMRAYLVAVSCVKQPKGTPYRDEYDRGRELYDGALHSGECRRCGPKGHPAREGSPLSAGHQHARAVRLVAKAILRDLWREARRVHGWDEEQAAA